MVLLGDCLERMRAMDENSVDAIVTDPPYALTSKKGAKGGFMGKQWDAEVPSVEIWKEALRVLKPGGHLLSFGGTRTYHNMAMNVELAGFEIRDQLQWLFGSGFPKSLDISKAIDKAAGAARKDLGPSPFANKGRSQTHNAMSGAMTESTNERITAPATPEAYRYKGWGTALKPSNEPIVLARKPLSEKTVAANVLRWGVGGLNIDASRIGLAQVEPNVRAYAASNSGNDFGGGRDLRDNRPHTLTQGRWPANTLFDYAAAEMLDEQSIAGGIHSAGKARGGSSNPRHTKNNPTSYEGNTDTGKMFRLGDSGGASRFFYVAKASKRERNAGLSGPGKQVSHMITGSGKPSGSVQERSADGEPNRFTATHQNFHPTVKPIKLMEYLIRLITPNGGTVLDPFCGSGSTGVAAFHLGFKFIGIEQSAEYCEIAKKRLEHARDAI